MGENPRPGLLEYVLVAMLLVVMVVFVLLTVGQQASNISSNLVRAQGDVPGWITVASTVGAALAGGAVGLFAPFIAHWLAAKEETRKAADRERRSIRAVVAELNDDQAILSILASGLPAQRPLSDREFDEKRDLLAECLGDAEFRDLAACYVQVEECKQEIAKGSVDKDRCRVLAGRVQERMRQLQRLAR
jgi:hypothetical protein